MFCLKTTQLFLYIPFCKEMYLNFKQNKFVGSPSFIFKQGIRFMPRLRKYNRCKC